MNQDYVNTVRLLLAIAPSVFRSPRLAMKGGTALNLFVQDMPRLSVDIDVVFTDHTLDRDNALRAISDDLAAMRLAITALGYRAVRPTTKSGDDVKLLVEADGLRVKVEVNVVLRGTVLPTVKTSLSDAAQELFTTELEIPMLDMSEQLPRSLTEPHREFLLSLVRAEPMWDLMPFKRLRELPAIEWKLRNLKKLKSSNHRRFDAQYEALAARFQM